jgi:hypothetical protein
MGLSKNIIKPRNWRLVVVLIAVITTVILVLGSVTSLDYDTSGIASSFGDFRSALMEKIHSIKVKPNIYEEKQVTSLGCKVRNDTVNNGIPHVLHQSWKTIDLPIVKV